MPPTLRAMVTLQELCGARPAEICDMRPCDIEKKRDVWIYRPQWHKTEYKGHVRVIVLGPRAQNVLTPLLDQCDHTRYLFSPAQAAKERAAIMRASRKSKVQPSQRDRNLKNPRKTPGEKYISSTYAKAVMYAVNAAKRAKEDVKHWSPNQLRHACGTRVRRKFGPESAGCVLGHTNRSGARVTDVYTRTAIEKEFIKTARKVMTRIG